jgi:hypothetical protein
LVCGQKYASCDARFLKLVWHAPNVMGVIDDTQIPITKPFYLYFEKYLFHKMEKGGEG